MDPKDEFKPPVLLHAQKTSNSPISPDRTVPALCPPNYGQYLLGLLDDSAARQLLKTGTSIEAAPATLWAILGDLFNISEQKQLPGKSVDQFLVSPRDLATNIYAAEDRRKIEGELLQQFILGVSHPGPKAELIRRSPDNIRDAIQLARKLEPQLHALKITADPGPRQLPPGNRNNRPGSRMICPYCRRFGRRAQRCGRNLQPVPPMSPYLFFLFYTTTHNLRLPGQTPITFPGRHGLFVPRSRCTEVLARWSSVSTKLITTNGTPLQTAGTALLSVSIG
ncbi:hypothetical protein X801_02842 [Opisthorchis viverrini]|uniref:Uncharacterized protein n=1 Tax=Opisthorchis viverrini TaxID=6198 RepID=A0A1S8X3F9_OPIVI|nr:hypothetical protein X801_02842 [Opisthorchis viverrini]